MTSYQHQISLSNIIILPNPLPSENEKNPRAPNPVPQQEYLYLSGSAFFVNVATPSKEFSNAKSAP